MLQARVAGNQVAIRTIDGGLHLGRVASFTPASPHIAIDSGAARAAVPAEQVAYVAFAREGAERTAPSAWSQRQLHVRLHGGEQIVVRAPAGGIANPLGFYAEPADDADPNGQYFFYRHGIASNELVHAPEMRPIEEEPIELDPLDFVLESDAERDDAQMALPREKTQIVRRPIEVADHAAQRPLRLGEILIEAELASAEDIALGLAEQKKRKGKRLGEVLVELRIVSEMDIARALSHKFELPFVDLDRTAIDPEAIRGIPEELLKKHDILPIAIDGNVLTVAIGDPLALQAIDAIRFKTKKRVREVVATPSQIRSRVDSAREGRERSRVGAEMETILQELADEGDRETTAAPEHELQLVDEADGAVIRLVNQIVLDGYRRGASDIHVEPNGRGRAVTVRFRIDGECAAYQEIPAEFRSAIVARIKIMASLDISERRKPQDGKIRFKLRDKTIELRVATVPTVEENEDVVLRILSSSRPLGLAELGMSERNLRELRAAIARPHGLFLCVGPTGSGKTTSLHSILAALNTTDTKIWTAEDPVEITQAGLRQVQVQPKIGFTFAAAMRSFLRADPDVIMVGEMRDHETAAIGIEASLTGHLVLSTLHTNSAPETVTRLVDMGLDAFSFSDALVGVLAQRLARSLCAVCRTESPGTREEWEQICRALGGRTRATELLGRDLSAGFTTFHGLGCEACGGSGYKGRVAIHELLIADDDMRRAIQAKAPAGVIREMAIAQGMTTLLEDGIDKALRGLTDLPQVFAVCGR
jgi:type II secretory ATPase GspE/PulE/Tfp pilus assembly ATPase PilB-like protein